MTPIEQLRAAIEVKGVNPRYHHELMAKHRAEWPVLWAAIDRLLVEEQGTERFEVIDVSRPEGKAFIPGPPLRRPLSIGQRVVCTEGEDRNRVGTIMRYVGPGKPGGVFSVLFDGDTATKDYGDEWLDVPWR